MQVKVDILAMLHEQGVDFLWPSDTPGPIGGQRIKCASALDTKSATILAYSPSAPVASKSDNKLEEQVGIKR